MHLEESIKGPVQGIFKNVVKWAMSEGRKHNERKQEVGDGHKSFSYIVAKLLVLNGLQKKLGLDQTKV